MKKIIAILLFLLIASPAIAEFQSDLYIQVHKEVNNSWTAKLPAWDVEIRKTPLLVNWESSLNYTMKRGGSMFNHHSVQTGINVGIEYPLTYRGNKARNDITSSFYITTSLDIRYIFAENDDGLPPGAECGNTTRLGVWSKF